MVVERNAKIDMNDMHLWQSCKKKGKQEGKKE